MAFTQEAQYSFTVQDALGVLATIRVYALLDPTKTVANVATDWQAFASALVGIIDGKILHGSARVELVPSADQSSKPTSGSRVEQTGIFTFPNESNPRLYGEAVASLSDSVISGSHIDLSNSDIVTFLGVMVPSSPVTSTPTTNQFLVLEDLQSALISFRKRRRSLDRVSYEPS